MREQVSIARQRRSNEGALRLVLRQTGQRTVLHECYFQVPLQVLRPLYLDETGTAYIYLVSPCGGVVGGDVYSMTVVVESEARVCLTTPSATKIYATHGTPARQQLDITLQAGAVLEYIPEQMIPFAQAAFRQQTTVRLGAGACVLLMEIIAPGRLARGEAFAYRDYDSSVCIEAASGQVLLRERTRLRPGWQRLDGPGLFEGYYYLGTFYALVEGMSLSAELTEHLHALLACRARAPRQREPAGAWWYSSPCAGRRSYDSASGATRGVGCIAACPAWVSSGGLAQVEIDKADEE